MLVTQNQSEKGERRKKEKKKASVLLRVYKFQAYKLFLPEKLLNKFLMQWKKKQLVSENWKGYEENKVCKAPIGRGLHIFSTKWGRALWKIIERKIYLAAQKAELLYYTSLS